MHSAVVHNTVSMAENALYYGDNLDILRRYIQDETIDLVYLDPPFKSKHWAAVLREDNVGAASYPSNRTTEPLTNLRLRNRRTTNAD